MKGMQGSGVRDYSHIPVEDIFSMFNLDDLFGDFFGQEEEPAEEPQRQDPAKVTIWKRPSSLLSMKSPTEQKKRLNLRGRTIARNVRAQGRQKAVTRRDAQPAAATGRSLGAADFSRWFRRVLNAAARGEVIKNPCGNCGGTGRVPKKRVIKVKIPPGVHEGQGIRVADEGEPGKGGGPHGDLYCYVMIKPHEFLQRDGNDVIAVVPINLTQAALGRYD